MSTEPHTIPDKFFRAADKAATSCFSGTSIRSRQGKLAIAKAINDAVMAERPKLQPIATAPNHERVMVAGWNNATKTVQGYWWWHEDVIVDGKAFEHPEATHWFPILKPEFPATPKARG